MITSMSVVRLRGIHAGSLGDMAGLSVLVGPNGCGKSTLLDALHVSAHPHPHTALHAIGGASSGRLVWRQGQVGPAVVHLWWGRMDRVITVADQDGGGPWPAIDEVRGTAPVTDLVRLVGGMPDPDGLLTGCHAQAAALGRGEAVAAAVRAVLPDCAGLEVRFEAGQPVLGAVLPHAFVPVADLGQGLHALVGLAVHLAATEPPALVLADGPDAFVHRDAVPALIASIRAAVGRGVQVVLTTQSLDTIDSLCCAFHDAPDDFAIFQIALSDGKLAVHRQAGADAIFARNIDSDPR